MKTSAFALSATLATLVAASAAPRLVVSTPSLTPESKIDLVLDLPAVAPTELGKTVDNTWLEIQPALPGKLLWKAQNIAHFVPDKPPAIGTSYTFSIPKGRKHADGSAVPPGKITTLDSEPFRIVAANAQNRWSEDYSPSTSQWLIVFNDDVDPATASAFISFSSNTGQRVAAKLEPATVARTGYYATAYKPWAARAPGYAPPESTPESPVAHALVATPVSPLPVGKGWVISTLKGLPNLSATARLNDDASNSIGDVTPFKISGIASYIAANQPRQVLINFNQPIAEKLPDDFLSTILSISPRPENLGAKVDGRQIRISGNFSIADKYTVTVRPSLASKAGLRLSGSVTEEIEFKHLEPGLALPSDNQAQLANGSRTYQIQTVNLSSLRLRIKKLAGTDLIRAYQGYQHYTGVGHDGESIQPSAPLPYPLVAGETVLEKVIALDNPIDTSKEITLSWDELLPQDMRNAALFIDVTGVPHPEAKQESRRSAQAMLQLTDIGLAWKITSSEAMIYAFSCDTGAPLPGVKLQLFGEDAKALDIATTDAAGLATIPRPDTIRHLHASLATDAYVTAFDATLSTVGMWHFPVRYAWNKSTGPTRRAFLFTDRSLYRPGETVRLKGIVRSQNGNAIEPAVTSPARLVIADPTNKEIHTSPVSFSDSGSFDLTYQLPVSKTGSYTIRLEYPEELAKAEALEDNWRQQETLLQSASFSVPVRVEEFRRNAFEVKQSIAAVEPAATSITADLTAAYYQGQPVAGGKVTHFSRVTAKNPYPPRFRDYLFGNHRRDDWSYWYHYFGYRWDSDYGSTGQTSQVQGETVLSADGTATLTVDIPQAEFPTAREVTLSAEVIDANNQTLTSSASTTVHPASVYVGVSRNDRLVRAGQAVPLKLVATDIEGEPFKGAVKLTATLTREINSAIKTRNDSGDTSTRNDVTEETVSTTEITLDPAASAGQGTEFIVTPESTGRHYLTLRGTDPEGRAFATVTHFHAYGTNEYPWLYEDGLRVKLVAEKKSYKPGETARVLVLSPIEGTALVTVEREKVLRSFQVQLKADNPVVEIPLGDDDAPNAFVSILIVKGAKESAREHKQPQLRLGYCELIVENLRDTLTVGLSTSEDTSYRPGDEVTLTGSVKLADGSPAANAEVTLYAEDEGTLAVMGYETPKPMDYFYRPRLLDVESGTSFQTFLSEDPDSRSFFNKGFFIGGGGDMEKLTDLLRKNFDPCATWAPALITDTSGNFSHTFKVPDTLTRYRVIAIAHHGTARFGHHESAIVVKKDLMLEPKSPRFANQSDTFDSQVLVQNASEFTGTWEVHFSTQTGQETPCVTPQGPVTQTVTLEPGKSATVVFPALADHTGEAVLTWQATPVSLSGANLTPDLTHRLSDAVETRFEVHYPMPLLRQSKLVKLDTPGTKQNLRAAIDGLLLDGSGTVDLEFARSPLVEAGGSIDFLLTYPYGCLEQTTSSLIPWLAVESLRPFVPHFAKIPQEKVESALQHGADRLLSMQLPNGSFTYWPGNSDTVSWANSYAAMGLIMAAESGANVPQSAIDGITSHLIGSLRGIAETKSASDLEIHARTLFVLTLAGKPQPAYMNRLRDRIAELTPNARAILATAMCSGDLENEENQAAARTVLNSKVPFKLKNDDWMPWTPDDAYQLIAWTAAEPAGNSATRFLDRMLNDRTPYGHWRTTWVNGWSLIAMAAYADSQDVSDASLAIQLETADGSETIHITSEQPTAARSFRLSPGLKLDLTSNITAFVRLKVAAKPKIAPIQPVATNGLSVDRIYERMNPDGTAEFLTEPKVGDLIRVSLRVTLPQDNSRYLVIDDPLPSIFETVNSDFKSQSAAAGIRTSENDWSVSHSELRTDRAVFHIDQVWRKGTYTVTYLVRCTVPGKATAPPAKVESMYDPENFALSASREFSTR